MKKQFEISASDLPPEIAEALAEALMNSNEIDSTVKPTPAEVNAAMYPDTPHRFRFQKIYQHLADNGLVYNEERLLTGAKHSDASAIMAEIYLLAASVAQNDAQFFERKSYDWLDAPINAMKDELAKPMRSGGGPWKPSIVDEIITDDHIGRGVNIYFAPLWANICQSATSSIYGLYAASRYAIDKAPAPIGRAKNEMKQALDEASGTDGQPLPLSSLLSLGSFMATSEDRSDIPATEVILYARIVAKLEGTEFANPVRELIDSAYDSAIPDALTNLPFVAPDLMKCVENRLRQNGLSEHAIRAAQIRTATTFGLCSDRAAGNKLVTELISIMTECLKSEKDKGE